jgi:phage-related protein (TIGR01555 family)
MANVMRKMFDGLQSFVANLGTERDKMATTGYNLINLAPMQLLTVYRSSWLPKKIVDIPALDSCREWRLWKANPEQIELIEEEERRLELRAKFIEARIKARLYGGSAIYFDTGQPPIEPLDLSAVKKGGLRFCTVLIAGSEITAGPLDNDALSPRYGLPVYYTVNTATGTMQAQVHPSRLAIFYGNRIPDPKLQGAQMSWGDSIITSVYDAVRQADATCANVASLIFEAKIDVITMEGLSEYMDGGPLEQEVRARYALAATMKGINGMLVLDGKETYNQKSASFATLPDIMDRMFQNAAGAADIPTTRLFGMSPGGMNATGESDLRNYYDGIASDQELEMRPAVSELDEAMIRSALGSRPDAIHYEWAPLWQLSAKEQADIFSTKANAARTIVGTGGMSPEIIPVAAMSEALISALVEDGILPGLEAAIEKFGGVEENEPDEQEQIEAMTPRIEQPEIEAPGVEATDAAPRTLYVRRDVLNASEIIAWAKSQGFKTTLTADDLHVTIIYSKTPVDWMKISNDWASNEKGGLTIKPGGPRLMDKFGEAVVLLFGSSDLSYRNYAMREAGCSWEFEDYQPHITLTYQAGDVDLAKIEPYRGVIELGPEIFEELNEAWRATIVEDRKY